MSSKIDPAHQNRERRGEPRILSDLPIHIQKVLQSIHSTCGTVGLFGSYARGDRIDDSDLDIGIKDFRAYKNIIKNISDHYNIRIDCNELNNKFHLVLKELTNES